MRFTVWRFSEGREPEVVGRETTAHEAETYAERLFAREGGRVVVVDGEAGDVLLRLPTKGDVHDVAG